MVIAGLQLVVVEAIVASAWVSPPYSYATNYISDLGVSGCPTNYGGRVICSPLAGLMNGAFVLEGVLFLLGALVLVSAAGGRRDFRGFWRWVFLGLAALHGVGSVLIGMFPETSSSGLHVPGATLAIAGGDLAVLAAGLALRDGIVGRVAIAIGIIGIAGAVLLETSNIAPDGVLERMGVYAVTAFDLLVGLWGLASRKASVATTLSAGAASVPTRTELRGRAPRTRSR
jgi:hypothetical membrane protein